MVMAGVYALMLCIIVGISATILQTLHLNDDAYRLMSGVITQHPTALCSYLLYVPLYMAICICGWATYKRHHHVKWFSAGNIASAIALYVVIAAILSVVSVPLFLDAALNPLFWLAYNIVGALLCTGAILGIGVAVYATRWVHIQLQKRRTAENEDSLFGRGSVDLVYPMDDPLLNADFVAFQNERDGTDNT